MSCGPSYNPQPMNLVIRLTGPEIDESDARSRVWRS